MKRWLLLVCVLASTNTLAVNLRGRVDIALTYGVVPMTGANVSLCTAGQGCVKYVTGSDGMYYFDTAPGDHVVMVNDVEHLRLTVPDQQSLDIDPIQVK